MEHSGAVFDIYNAENSVFPVATEEDHDAQSTHPFTGVGHDGGSADATGTSRHAAPMTFTAILSAANEVQTPPVVSPATGLATIVLDPTAHTLQISATFSGLLSTVAAHIHSRAGRRQRWRRHHGATFPGFPIEPMGVTSGTYGPMSFNLTQALIYNPAFVTLQGGLAQAEATLTAGMIAGLTYFNIHTVGFPGGEI